MSQIDWTSNRELKKFDCNIDKYFKDLTELWNVFFTHIKINQDRRTNEYKSYNNFFYKLLYMWDMIKQTEKQYQELLKTKDSEIIRLQKELDKWTKNQHGKKSILTKEKKDKIVECKKMSMSNREIAKRINVSEGTVRNFLKKYSSN